MTRKFDEKHSKLINSNTPRTFTSRSVTDNSDIPIECPTLETAEHQEPSADGFIAAYCCEDSK